MGYALIKPEVLTDKGIEHYETLPDGRAIVDFSMLKVLGSITDVEILSTAEEVIALRKEEEESGLYDKPEPLPEEGQPQQDQPSGDIPSEEVPPADGTEEPQPGTESPEAGTETQESVTETPQPGTEEPAEGTVQPSETAPAEETKTETTTDKEGGIQ